MIKLRISAGNFKNISLQVPESARPVMERVKLAIFSVINDYVADAACLDLFAGSGNLGFEALSRGAASCDFVDDDYYSIKCIKENVEKIESSFKPHMAVTVNKEDVLKYTANIDNTYDLIFIDPPYAQDNHKHLFKLIHEVDKVGTIIVYLSNHSNKIFETIESINPNLKIIDSRKYGITHVDIIEVKETEVEVRL